MSNTNIVSKKIWLLVAGFIACALFVVLTPKVHADAADDACKSEKGQKNGACVTGYKGGYADPDEKAAKICEKYKVDANNKACRSGVTKGRDAKEKEETASNNKVPVLGSKGNADICGDGANDEVRLKIDIGCQGASYDGPGGAIGDMLFAVVRFLSIGVGVVVVIAIITAGIQYTTSEGNPEATQNAKNRIQASLISLVIYMFIFAIVQFLVPGGLLK